MSTDPNSKNNDSLEEGCPEYDTRCANCDHYPWTDVFVNTRYRISDAPPTWYKNDNPDSITGEFSYSGRQYKCECQCHNVPTNKKVRNKIYIDRNVENSRHEPQRRIINENEIKEYLNISVEYFENINQIKEFKNNSSKKVLLTEVIYFEELNKLKSFIKNPIIFLKKKNTSDKKLKDVKNQVTLPTNLNFLVEKCKILYLKYEFSTKSNIQIKDYILNINSRIIHKNRKKLKLTERENNFLLYLYNSSKSQKISTILKTVWGYSSNIETHTVETHVHRLRKKFENKFNDNSLIRIDKDGYYIR